jgi:phage I-like protein
VPKAEFLALKAKFDEREVDELIAAAMQKGKISPATKDTYRALALKDRQAFTEIMAKIPDYSVVPLKHIETAAAAGSGELSETDLLIAKALGKANDEKYLAALKATAKSLQN